MHTEVLEARLLCARHVHLPIPADPVTVVAVATAPLAGDANLDGTVGIVDYNIVVANFGKTNVGWAGGDFDGNGVGLSDYVAVVRNYGRTWQVPPASGVLPITAMPTTGWTGPITITQGGTYTGNWQSNNANTPAVTIATTAPVVISNANLSSRGTLVDATGGHANVTILNCRGWGLNPNISGRSPGRFLDAENFTNVDVENNALVGTAGIEMGFYAGNGTASQTVKILKNNALNIDGRWSNGSNGFQTGVDANDLVQFAQFNACHNLAGVEIAWNQVINQPGVSRVEDNISVFQSSGTAASPMLIHDNYINGAYAVSPTTDNSFSGGGIMVSDGWTGSVATATGNVHCYNNLVIGTTNYGIAVSSGRNNQVYNNFIVSSGIVPGTTKVAASQNVGLYIWNTGDPNFANNTEWGNTLGWAALGGGRNDSWLPDVTASPGKPADTALAGTITLSVEQSQVTAWLARVTAAGVTIGH